MSLLVAAAVAIFLIPTDEPAVASPASALLDAVKARMAESYYAPPGADVTRAMDEASRKLAEACATQGATCPTETGLEVARRALAEIGDRHTTISRMPAPPP